MFLPFLLKGVLMEKEKRKNKRYTFISILIFIIGLLILLYPFISAVYYDYQATTEVDDFDKHIKTMNEREIDARIQKAKAYNTTLTSHEMLTDTFTDDQKEAGKALYAQMLEVREKIGHVEIPSIHQDIPLFAGTSDEVLNKGLGHLERTSLPVGGPSTHTVITGHRGLPDKKLFTDLDKVKKGDMVYVHNIKEILAYKIDHIEVITPYEFEPLKIKSGKDQLTLLTCTPYMINSHRLIVTGHRVPYDAVLQEEHKRQIDPWWWKFMNVYKYYLIGLLMALLLYLLYRWYKKRKERLENQQD
ncbi:class C sortase [Macrococcoides canis]|nr:class C sortase [Macrococcus canis]